MTRADIRQRLALTVFTERQRTYVEVVLDYEDAADAGADTEALKQARRASYRAMTDAERDGVTEWSAALVREDAPGLRVVARAWRSVGDA